MQIFCSFSLKIETWIRIRISSQNPRSGSARNGCGSETAANVSPLWAGVSLTSSACALVYLVDRAGVRTTTEQFYALAGNNVAHTLFRQTHLLAAIFYETPVFFQQIRRDKLL
jgi:hypothetical protein